MIITKPAINLYDETLLNKIDPILVATDARETNTIEKPITKKTVPTTRVLGLWTLLLDMIEKNPGTSGNMQGEKKDKIPKINAIDKFISILGNTLTPILATYRAYIFFM